MEAGFTLDEVVELRRIYMEMGEESLSPVFCQQLAKCFNLDSEHAKKPITWQLVQNWFKQKQETLRLPFGASPVPRIPCLQLSEPVVSSNLPESSEKPKGKGLPDITGLKFEARSSIDNAWHDVGSFLKHRVHVSGELQVRVRFAGFRNTDDEWVNVKTDLRERSIPLEPAECHMVNVGDLVMSFQEKEEQSLYFDAHVVAIQRQDHDATECKCIFLVRYDHDNSEDEVQCSKLCRRPSE